MKKLIILIIFFIYFINLTTTLALEAQNIEKYPPTPSTNTDYKSLVKKAKAYKKVGKKVQTENELEKNIFEYDKKVLKEPKKDDKLINKLNNKEIKTQAVNEIIYDDVVASEAKKQIPKSYGNESVPSGADEVKIEVIKRRINKRFK